MIHLIMATESGRLASIEAFREYADAQEHLYALMRGVVRSVKPSKVNGRMNSDVEKVYQELMKMQPHMTQYRLLSLKVQGQKSGDRKRGR